MEEELDLLELWQIFYKRWKLILLVTLFSAAGCALVCQFLVKPRYLASTSLIMMSPAEAEETLFQEVVHSPRVLDKVSQNLDLPYRPDQLKEKVTLTLVQKSGIITIEVADSEPQRAARISTMVARSFTEEIAAIMNLEDITLLNEAVVPGAPVSPRIRLNMAIAAVLGFMVAAAIVLLQHYLDDTIRDEAEVKKLLGLTVLGTIPVMEDK